MKFAGYGGRCHQCAWVRCAGNCLPRVSSAILQLLLAAGRLRLRMLVGVLSICSIARRACVERRPGTVGVQGGKGGGG